MKKRTVVLVTLLSTLFMGGTQAWAASDRAIKASDCTKTWNHWNHYYKGGRFHAGYTMSDVTYLYRGGLFDRKRYGLLFGRVYAWGGRVEKCTRSGGLFHGGELAPSMEVRLEIRLTGTALSESCTDGINVDVSDTPAVQLSHSCTKSPSGKVVRHYITAKCPKPIATCPITSGNLRLSLGPDAELHKRWWEVRVRIWEKPNFQGVMDEVWVH